MTREPGKFGWPKLRAKGKLAVSDESRRLVGRCDGEGGVLDLLDPLLGGETVTRRIPERHVQLPVPSFP